MDDLEKVKETIDRYTGIAVRCGQKQETNISKIKIKNKETKGS